MKPNAVERALKPVELFMRAESTAGLLLLASALLALLIANSPFKEHYSQLWETHLVIKLGEHGFDKSLHHWINDGLMSMFFFLVGLELKREIIAGELANFRKAILPLVAALGGMIVPALIFLLFNRTGAGMHGWGIPMATDIAFVLGVIALLGKRVPVSLKVFLTALAIADDLGAVLVIAFFYTSDISFVNLITGIGFITLLVVANRLGVRHTLFYGIVGIGGVWTAFLMSGVHATIAGVLAAIAIPARTKINEAHFVNHLEQYALDFKQVPPNNVALLEPEQTHIIERINKLVDEAATPLQRLENKLHPWVAFLVMPLFAFANAGIELSPEMFNRTFFQGVSMGVISGLVIGKFVGIVTTTWLMYKFRLSELPASVTWRHLCGAAALAGVGFTMSLFITNLAFTSEVLIEEAKVGIFCGSILSGLIAFFILRSGS